MSTPADPRAALLAFALSLPEAWEDQPWGETVVKVRKKVFLFLGHGEEGLGLSVKLPDSMLDALDEPDAAPTGYGLGRAGWVSLRYPPGTEVPLARLEGWVRESYRAVAPKTLSRQL